MTANPLALRTQLLALVEFNCHAIIAGSDQKRKSATMNLETIVQSDILKGLIPKYGRVYTRMSLAAHIQDICDAPDDSSSVSSCDDKRKPEEARDEESQASVGHDEEEDEGLSKPLSILGPAGWQRLIERVERLRREVLRVDANAWVDEPYNEDGSPSTPHENRALDDELAQRSAFSTKYEQIVLRYKIQRALSFIRRELRHFNSEETAAEATVAENDNVAKYRDFVETTFSNAPSIKERLLSVLLPMELDSLAQDITPQTLKLKSSNEVEKIIGEDYLSLRVFKRSVANMFRQWEELALSESELVARGFGGNMLPPKGDTTAVAGAAASASSSVGVADSPSKNYFTSGTRSKRTNVRKKRSRSAVNEEEDVDEEEEEGELQSLALLTQPSSQQYRYENEPKRNFSSYRTKGFSRYQHQSLQQTRDSSTSDENDSGLEADYVTAMDEEGFVGVEESRTSSARNNGRKRKRRIHNGRRSNSSGDRESYQRSGSRGSMSPAPRNRLSRSSIQSLDEAVQALGASVRAIAAAGAFSSSGNVRSRSSSARATKERSARTLDFSDSESGSFETGSNFQSPQEILAERIRVGSITKKGTPRKKRRPFTDEEKAAINEGVEEFGFGKWADIKARYNEELGSRTSVQIKDCYRTMMKQG